MYDEYVQNDLLLISISFLFAVVVVSEICGVVGPSMIVSHAVELLEVMTTLALPLHLQEKHVAYNWNVIKVYFNFIHNLDPVDGLLHDWTGSPKNV